MRGSFPPSRVGTPRPVSVRPRDLSSLRQVSPCEIAAGISSTKQVYPPSFAGSKTAVNFIAIDYIARAEASRDGNAPKVFIELRDVNYPSSTYSLTYDPASDQLKGIYHQAVERQRFPVSFVRVK
jgi:hypothetical protein